MKLEIIERIKDIGRNEDIEFLNLSEDLSFKKDYIEYKCNKCGNTGKITAANLLDSRRKSCVCSKCNSRIKFENAIISNYGRNPYIFLTEFISYKDPITVKCKDCGFEFTEKNASALLMNFRLPKGAHPCKNCTAIRFKKKKDISELENALKEKFGSCNYIFPEPEKYMGLSSKKKFKIICKYCGNEMYTYINNILNPKNKKHYCRVCNNKDRPFENLNYYDRCKLITNGQIEPLEDYVNNRTPIKHKCNVCGYGEDGSWLKLPVKLNSDHNGCPKCSNIKGYSSEEKEVVEYLKSLGIKNIIENYVILDGKEIDIYLQDYNIGIEYDGLYWHADDKKDKNYHIDKTMLANSKGIRLIHIFEDEWYFKKDIVKMKLKNIVNKNNDIKLYARKCEIIIPTSKEKNEFLNKYHIQGEDKCRIIYGLKYNGELVAVMTFSKLRKSLGNKGDNEGAYELSRFASKYRITGGFSKLFKHTIKEHPEILEVVTYADIRWSDLNKNVYTSTVFKLDHISKPNYWYFDSKKSKPKRIHRYNFRKQVLKEKFPGIYKDELTEFQIMDKTEYKRIWDCGNLVYKWKREQ